MRPSQHLLPSRVYNNSGKSQVQRHVNETKKTLCKNASWRIQKETTKRSRHYYIFYKCNKTLDSTLSDIILPLCFIFKEIFFPLICKLYSIIILV